MSDADWMMRARANWVHDEPFTVTVLDGRWVCGVCGYEYDGRRLEDITDDWVNPATGHGADCGCISCHMSQNQ